MGMALKHCITFTTKIIIPHLPPTMPHTAYAAHHFHKYFPIRSSYMWISTQKNQIWSIYQPTTYTNKQKTAHNKQFQPM